VDTSSPSIKGEIALLQIYVEIQLYRSQLYRS